MHFLRILGKCGEFYGSKSAFSDAEKVAPFLHGTHLFPFASYTWNRLKQFPCRWDIEFLVDSHFKGLNESKHFLLIRLDFAISKTYFD